MTIEEARERVEAIRDCARDYERAHGEEDDLRNDVLQAIADGHPDAVELAKIALSTNDLKFARYCA